MKKTHNDSCKGCYATNPDNINLLCVYLFHFKTNQNRKCPCSNCLVKVVCADSCSELAQTIRIKYKNWGSKDE